MKFINTFLPLIIASAAKSFSLEHLKKREGTCTNVPGSVLETVKAFSNIQDESCSFGLSKNGIDLLTDPFAVHPECSDLYDENGKNAIISVTNSVLKHLKLSCLKDEQGQYCPFSVTAYYNIADLDKYKATAYENIKSQKCLEESVKLTEDLLNFTDGNQNVFPLNYDYLKEGHNIMKTALNNKTSCTENFKRIVTKCGGLENSQDASCSQGLTEECTKFYSNPFLEYPECVELYSEEEKNKLVTYSASFVKYLKVTCLKDEQNQYCPISVSIFNRSELDEVVASANENIKSTKCNSESIKYLEDLIAYSDGKFVLELNYDNLKKGLEILKSGKGNEKPIDKPTETSTGGNVQPTQLPTETSTGGNVQPTEQPTGGNEEPTEQPTGGNEEPTEQPTGGNEEPSEQPTGGNEEPTEQPTGDNEEPSEQPTGDNEEPSDGVDDNKEGDLKDLNEDSQTESEAEKEEDKKDGKKENDSKNNTKTSKPHRKCYVKNLKH